jgi:hypothetical protein
MVTVQEKINFLFFEILVSYFLLQMHVRKKLKSLLNVLLQTKIVKKMCFALYSLESVVYVG